MGGGAAAGNSRGISHRGLRGESNDGGGQRRRCRQGREARRHRRPPLPICCRRPEEKRIEERKEAPPTPATSSPFLSRRIGSKRWPPGKQLGMAGHLLPFARGHVHLRELEDLEQRHEHLAPEPVADTVGVVLVGEEELQGGREAALSRHPPLAVAVRRMMETLPAPRPTQIPRSTAIRPPCATPFSRAHWQTTCAAILATTTTTNAKAYGAPRVNGDSIKPALSDHAAQPLDLDLLPVSNLPRPLTITDLSPAPMHGSQLRVAYQGVPGAYSEAAAAKAYPSCDAIPCDQFEVAFQAVELWIADRAVLPVENSLGGSIHRNYDLLLRHRLHIVGEVQLPVHHCLLALPGVRRDLLTRVISHPQALAQCELTLNAMGLNVAREAFDDTAAAAEHVAAAGLRDTAAIASSRAAELYGLQVLADGIQDDAGNVTRFVMLAREPIIPRTDRPFKTSIVFAHDREGTSASMAEVRAQNALSEIQEFTSFLRVLGSYPMDMTPWEYSSSGQTAGDTSSS
uniref:arogenate dehydratase n=1 Tax=Oryza meridionalis TaxID=40149 RepID=A0A0E0C6V8_9ORYZ